MPVIDSPWFAVPEPFESTKPSKFAWKTTAHSAETAAAKREERTAQKGRFKRGRRVMRRRRCHTNDNALVKIACRSGKHGDGNFAITKRRE